MLSRAVLFVVYVVYVVFVLFSAGFAQAAMPPRKSPYLTPWSERSGDSKRGYSVWLKISKTFAGLRPSGWLKNPG